MRSVRVKEHNERARVEPKSSASILLHNPRSQEVTTKPDHHPHSQEQKELVLHNVSALLQQLGEQIDSRERQLQRKTETEYQRNERTVSNTIMNLFTSIVVLMREAIKRALLHILKDSSNSLKKHFDLGASGTLAFVAQGTQEQEAKQTQVTTDTLKNTQAAWREALKATQPPEASVETHIMNQAQDSFKKLDCHRRVLVVALQTYQTNHLQAEIKFIENVYNIKTKSVRALWQRLQHLVQQYRQEEEQLVTSTVSAVQAIQRKQEQNNAQSAKDKARFVERLRKMWSAYKANTLLVDDTSTEANDLRVAIDTLLAGESQDFVQATDMLQKHWQIVAQHVESCTVTGKNAKLGNNNPKKAALQKNADKMMFCAKNRANVLQNPKQYRNTQEWIRSLKKWDAAMTQLETEAHALRVSNPKQEVPASCVPSSAQEHGMIVTHRQWKRLVFALPPLAQRLQERQQELRTQESTMYAVLLNKVGYELKQALDAALLKQTLLEEEHSDTERAQVELEETNFKLLQERYQQDSRYMDSELQGYGESANKCRELITKLFKLKVWQEHATHLQQQLRGMQPLVVQISKYIEMEK